MICLWDEGPSMSDVYQVNAFEAAQSLQFRFYNRLLVGKICWCPCRRRCCCCRSSSFPLLSPLPSICFLPSFLPFLHLFLFLLFLLSFLFFLLLFLLSLPPSIRFSYMLHPYIKFWAFLLCFFLLLMLWNLPNEFSSWSCHASWLLSFPVWRQQPVLTTLNDLFF